MRINVLTFNRIKLLAQLLLLIIFLLISRILFFILWLEILSSPGVDRREIIRLRKVKLGRVLFLSLSFCHIQETRALKE